MKRDFPWREVLCAVLATVVLLSFLGSRGLNEPDEGRYAEIGREMAAGSEWLVPHLNGFEHFQKPPLLYWATALSIRLFGANEWAARLPSALAALGTLAATWLIGRKLIGPKRALTAVVVLLSSLEFFALARLLSPDMQLTFWVTAALAAFVYHRRWLLFVCMGLGFLAKGPMAFVVPAAAVLGWQFASRGGPEKVRVPWVRGLAIAIALGLAWFIALSVMRPELFDYFWRYELVERFASGAHGRSKPFWFFVPVLLLGTAPWTPVLLAAARTGWMRVRAKQMAPAEGLLLGWVLPPLLILSLSGSKLLTYVLPLFPALALAVALKLRAPERAWRIAAPALALWLLGAGLMPVLTPYLGPQAPVNQLVAMLRAQPDYADAGVFACEVRAHGVEFYLQRLVSVTHDQADIVLKPSPAQQERLFASPEACEAHFAGLPRAYGITRRARLGKTFKPDRWSVLAQEGDFVLVVNAPSERSGLAEHRGSRF